MMEEEQEPAATESSPMLAMMQAMQAQLNALQSSGGRGRDPKNSHPSAVKIPGLSYELINARKARGLCIKCGQKGHMKWECTNPADVKTQPSGN